MNVRWHEYHDFRGEGWESRRSAFKKYFDTVMKFSRITDPDGALLAAHRDTYRRSIGCRTNST